MLSRINNVLRTITPEREDRVIYLKNIYLYRCSNKYIKHSLIQEKVVNLYSDFRICFPDWFG